MNLITLKNIHSFYKLKRQLKYYVFLNTCNRHELYFCSEKKIEYPKIIKDPHQIKKHLFYVVSGLDSKIIGETQIQAQVKSAYLKAVANKTCNKELHQLFQEALHIGKVIRTKTNISKGAISYAQLALNKIKPNKNIALIGNGKLSHNFINLAKKKNINVKYIFSRNSKYKIKDIPKYINDIDIIISATNAPHCILKKEHIRSKKLLIIDLAVPHDVDPKVKKLPNVTIINIKDLEKDLNKTNNKRKKEAQKAKNIITKYLNVITVGSRPSRLAIAQVKEAINIPHKIKTYQTDGDINKKISLINNNQDDLFTRQLDEAVVKGEIDCAIHSAKDLPETLSDGLMIAAITKGKDNTDVLVYKKKKITNIGTSSILRKKEIKKIFPKVTIRSIRGTIEERLKKLDQGKYDAIIMAKCALDRLNIKKYKYQKLPYAPHPLQGKLAVVIQKESKNVFKNIDDRKNYGKVYLVGAGPGDPDLITIKGKKILKKADIILYDNLINKKLLKKLKAKKIYVGKRKGNHSHSQNEINYKLALCAFEGKTVVRLKGGDPSFFSRAGEEIEYLNKCHIKTEIIPGISSPQAAITSFNTTLTHRNKSHNVSFCTAHKKPISVPNTDTIVYFMSADTIKELQHALIKNGRSPYETVSLVQNASLHNEKKEITTIANLVKTKLKSPLIVIISKQKILFTGLSPENYTHLGNITHYPLIETKPVHCKIKIDKYDAIVFTSKNAVKYFPKVKNKKIFAIGKETEKELERKGIKTNYLSPKPNSRSLQHLIKKSVSNKILYPTSNLSKNSISQLPNVTTKIIYKTIPIKQPKINLNEYGTIFFTSPSTVDAFLKIYKKLPHNKNYMVLGPTTKKRLKI
ncbi:uroporphyrinogen-III C-methyltransferase [Candidatus Margulisiibacteriota bacterium]